MNPMTHLFCMTTMLCLSACCTQGVKPGESNFLQAACGVASGDFEKQAQQTEQNLKQSRNELLVEQNRKKANDANLIRIKKQYQQDLDELRRIEQETNELRSHLNTIEISTAKDRQLQKEKSSKLRELTDKIIDLESSIEKKEGHVHQQELTQLKQEVDALRMIILAQ